MDGSAPADELRALVRLTAEELARVPGGIGSLHHAVAHRVFAAVGPASAPTRAVHDAVAGAVYRGVAAGATLAGTAAGSLVARRGGEPDAVSTHRRGAALLAVINGLSGDVLAARGDPLEVTMGVYAGGRRVPLDAASLRRTFPRASGHVAVFVHGLMETEHSWSLGARTPRDTYAHRLERDIGCTAVHVRYNTGRHISENGRLLDGLLEELAAAWPVPVTELSLVGHSMGGLVARSACHQAERGGAAWVRRVRHVVSLGTPHLGAPLEQGVHVAAHVLAALPETRPIAGFLRRRSAGIRDLRRGSLVDEDWRDRDPDALRAGATAEVPLLRWATHCFVSASVTRDPRHPLGRLIGDILVLEPSATGRGRRRRFEFPPEHGLHVGGTHHFALLNHPRVYERLRAWLGAGRPEVAAAGC